MGTFVGSSATSLLGSLAATPMSQAERCFQSAAHSSAPHQASGFLVVQSLQTLAVGVQMLFPDSSLGKDIKWLKASCLSSVVYIWSMGKIPTTQFSLWA